MTIVKYKNQSGAVYAYDQTSVYDPVKKQSRPVRKYLGRVDPETGEIISTKGKRGRPPKHPKDESGKDPGTEDFKKLYQDKCREAEALEKAISQANAEKEALVQRIEELCRALSDIRTTIDSVT